jgi:hypothetical protein
VRLRWRAEEIFEEEVEEGRTSVDKPPPIPASEGDSLLGRGSFFGKRTEAPLVAKTIVSSPSPVELETGAAMESTSAVVSAAESAAPGRTASVKTVKGTDWKKDALERFKTMPNVSKYR